MVWTLDCGGANAKEAAVGHGRREEVSSPGEHPDSGSVRNVHEATDPPGSGHSPDESQHISTQTRHLKQITSLFVWLLQSSP